MASVQKVQSFLAYWFQLGKPVVLQPGNTDCLPTPVFEGTQLSPTFQACWRQIMAHPEQSFLQGTDESIAELLSDAWDIEGCARCTMPIPMPVRGIKSSPCPCADLSSWPNEEVPLPRPAVCTQAQLDNIRQRLTDDRDRLQMSYFHSPALPPIARPLPPLSNLKTSPEPSALDG